MQRRVALANKSNKLETVNILEVKYSIESLVQSGHAEIEANKILYIFGNALEVLQRSEFYD